MEETKAQKVDETCLRLLLGFYYREGWTKFPSSRPFHRPHCSAALELGKSRHSARSPYEGNNRNWWQRCLITDLSQSELKGVSATTLESRTPCRKHTGKGRQLSLLTFGPSCPVGPGGKLNVPLDLALFLLH